MKANAPEKIYFSQTEDGRQYFTPAIPFEREFIMYMPVDAFIEKAENYLRNTCQRFILTEKDIDDFVKYMKGE